MRARPTGRAAEAMRRSRNRPKPTALIYWRKYGGKSCLVRVWARESFIGGTDGRLVRAIRRLGTRLQRSRLRRPPWHRRQQFHQRRVRRWRRADTPIAPLPVPPTERTGVAHVIGNDAYQKPDRLQKVVTNARTIAASLTMLGFEVIRVEDAPRRTMDWKIMEFASKVGRGGIAFFFTPDMTADACLLRPNSR
jgi:hypothetical protein